MSKGVKMNKEMILTYLRTHKDEFRRKYGIEKIALFGSYARGDARVDSDVDILYCLKDGVKMSFDSYMDLEEQLEKAFQTKIDLINEKKLNPLIRIDAAEEFVYV